jgi:hypothetical protein
MKYNELINQINNCIKIGLTGECIYKYLDTENLNLSKTQEQLLKYILAKTSNEGSRENSENILR